MDKNSENGKIEYQNLSRIDVLCGHPLKLTVHACEKCRKESCKGLKACKGFGAYSLGVKLRG